MSWTRWPAIVVVDSLKLEVFASVVREVPSAMEQLRFGSCR